jgi:hypothetical protein
MPAQKRGHDAAEDDPVQDTQSSHHEHLEDAEGTSVTLASPKINLAKIFTTERESFAFANILFRDFDCLFCLTCSFFCQNLIEALRRVTGTTRTSAFSLLLLLIIVLIDFFFLLFFSLVCVCVCVWVCASYRASCWVNAGFDLGSACLVWWHCFVVVFYMYFLKEVRHGCVLSDNFE